ncbi:MFS transporter [Phenylobacterium sp. LjRoot219]|uniref:MFS transporter n=1 Tax=Phenylobacterium sp. LjRoot219 TaxID=3342283 RepID=UPI003ECEEFF5
MKRIYYGWYVVAIATAVYMLMIGATFAAFGLYVLPVSAEFNLSRADMNTALILMNLGNAFLAPFIGRLLDRVPARRIMITCALLMGGSFLVLGLSHSLWLSAAVLAVALPAAYLGAGTLTMTVLIARWFTAQRGRAMALAAIGMSLGNITVTPLVGMVIENQGWRTALLLSGGAVATLLMVLALVLRERPGPGDVEGGRAAAAPAPAVHPAAPAVPAKVGAILKAPQFWSLSLGASLAMAVGQALAITLVPLAVGNGLTLIQATSLISVMGGAAIAGTLLLAVVADKVDRVSLLAALFLAGALINVGLHFEHSYALLVGSAGLLGLTLGAATPAFYALLADRFGAASFGTVRGLTMPVIAGLGMIAIRLAGEVFDRTGGYELMFSAFVVAQLVAAALIFLTRFVSAPIVAGAPARAATS